MEYPPLPHTKEVMTYEEFRNRALEAFAEQLQAKTYPGYPSPGQRLHGEAAWASLAAPDPTDAIPTVDEQRTYLDNGLQLDALGRPLHPWLDAMIEDPRIGIVTGKRAYYEWGPNYTADPIICREGQDGTEILLIKRGDTGQWALPGGFVDPDETAEDTAKREAAEETGIDTDLLTDGALVYGGPIADLRMTAHAWPHTYAYRFEVAGDPDLQPDYDEVDEAAWWPAQKLAAMMHGSHLLLIEAALGKQE